MRVKETRFLKEHLAFGTLMGISLFVLGKPLWILGQFSLGSEQYSHILLIPAVALVLLYQDWGKVVAHVGKGWPLGGALVGVSGLLYSLYLLRGLEWSENDRISLVIFAAVLLWIGLFQLIYGKRAYQQASFPLCFLLLMVPIPEAILGGFIGVLQQASTEVTDVLFRITGMTAFRHGTVFLLPGVAIEVARECSGIRSSLALFITSILAGHMFLRTKSRKILLYATVFPITVLKNGLRILFLSSYAVYVDPAILDSTAHRRGGVPFFGLALLALGAVLWFLRKTEDGSRTLTQEKAHSGARETGD